MKFKFPLQKLLENRKTLEDVAQRDFQESFSDLKNEIRILKELEEQLQSAYQKAFQFQSLGGSKAIDQLAATNNFIKGQVLRIEIQKTKVKDREKLVEERREILRQKAIDYKIIERLKERRKQAFLKELEKTEQKEIDELSVLRYKTHLEK